MWEHGRERGLAPFFSKKIGGQTRPSAGDCIVPSPSRVLIFAIIRDRLGWGAIIIGGAVVTRAHADVYVYVPFAGRSPLRWALVSIAPHRDFSG
jgi:hypothetical protein